MIRDPTTIYSFVRYETRPDEGPTADNRHEEDRLEFHAFEEILDAVQPAMVLGTVLAMIFQAGVQLA